MIIIINKNLEHIFHLTFFLIWFNFFIRLKLNLTHLMLGFIHVTSLIKYRTKLSYECS